MCGLYILLLQRGTVASVVCSTMHLSNLHISKHLLIDVVVGTCRLELRADVLLPGYTGIRQLPSAQVAEGIRAREEKTRPAQAHGVEVKADKTCRVSCSSLTVVRCKITCLYSLVYSQTKSDSHGL